MTLNIEVPASTIIIDGVLESFMFKKTNFEPKIEIQHRQTRSTYEGFITFSIDNTTKRNCTSFSSYVESACNDCVQIQDYDARVQLVFWTTSRDGDTKFKCQCRVRYIAQKRKV